MAFFLFQWLKDEFLTYLDCWEKSVHDREGFSSAEKKMMLLSQETRNGLRITGILHTYIICIYIYIYIYNTSLYMHMYFFSLFSEIIC